MEVLQAFIVAIVSLYIQRYFIRFYPKNMLKCTQWTCIMENLTKLETCSYQAEMQKFKILTTHFRHLLRIRSNIKPQSVEKSSELCLLSSTFCFETYVRSSAYSPPAFINDTWSPCSAILPSLRVITPSQSLRNWSWCVTNMTVLPFISFWMHSEKICLPT